MTATDAARLSSDAPLVLEVDGVDKEYPGDPPTKVLRDVSLNARSGELLAIVGPSGSGKSTLLNIIGTLDRPTNGRVTIAGYDTSELSDRQLSGLRAYEIGFVFQQFFLLSGMSAIDNVGDGMLYSGMTQRTRRQHAVEALERVGLAHRLNHDPSKLSGGERQRVAVVGALVGNPSLILADGPHGNLDSRPTGAIIELLHEHN